jgi:hypothetical protein
MATTHTYPVVKAGNYMIFRMNPAEIIHPGKSIENRPEAVG